MTLKLLLFASIAMLSPICLLAQNKIKIYGSVKDTILQADLPNMTVCVLNAKDSTIVAFDYSKVDGSFSLLNLPPGNYILLISYPNYADYVEKFSLITSITSQNFGSIIMNSKIKLLEAIIIKGKLATIQMKGDTTEYNAKGYVIQPNDKVEDLLKQLPGIQVDQNGKITAQGQTVTKVLLDGEEFFGDDPTIVTKNIRADMVDKVQLFDKKSDQATFTGIDDGNTTKTLNIKLKEDKNKGVFGKANAGIATRKYYDAQAMFNKFASKKKYAAFFTIANDGKTGFLDVDNSRIGSSTVRVRSNGLINIENGGEALDSYNGNYSGIGNPSVKNAGLHYDGKWNDINTQSINANYQIGSIRVTGVNTTNTQQSLPSGLINTASQETFDNYAFRQKMDVTYKIKLDSTSDLEIVGDWVTKKFNAENDHVTKSETGDNNLINRQARRVENKGYQEILDGSMLYTKKFHKPRRTLAWELINSYNKNETKGYLHSIVDFFNVLGTIDSTENINQFKNTKITNFILTNNITYTEPVSKSVSLLLTYEIGLNKSGADRKSFNQSAAGHYDSLDLVYSNNYSFYQFTNQGSGKLIFKKNKTYFNFGTNVSTIKFTQKDINSKKSYERTSVNWMPQFFLKYSFSLQRLLIVVYNGSTTQPNIEQIQPVRSNLDPLNIIIGNPNLKQSFTNNFRINYQVNNPINGLFMYLEAQYAVISQNISSNVATDPATGKTTIQYVNLSDKNSYNYSLFADLSRPINLGGIRVDFIAEDRGLVSFSYINNILNSAHSSLYRSAIRLSKNIQNKFSFSISVGPNYTVNKLSLQPQYNNNAFGFNSYGSGRLFLPAKFQLATDIDYTYAAKSKSFGAQKRTLWNATVTRTFLKGDNFKIAISGNDLLNQNKVLSRSIHNGALIQSSSTKIQRYYMLTMSWDFTKFGMVAAKN